ncbi:MAG: FG-GAP repeat protein, partial [Thermoanaerobaculia bacterium]|nr:FG-GAP repeat protein [Thermoanaerobaculia bacterium]
MRSGLCSAPRTAPTLLAIALALGSTSPVAAALYGHRSQELSDGTGGLVTPGSAFANDGLGRALAVGDWNGDGYDDLAVAEMESLLGQNEGAVRILYSTSAGLLGAGALPPQLIYDFIPETGALDREAFDDFGSALAAGNFDCDAYDDLVIAIPGENIGAAADAGAVLVLQGSPAGLVTANLLDFEPQRFYQGLASVGDAAETG